MEKILITGISGMLGSNLAYYFRNKYDIAGLYNSFPVEIDGVSSEKCDLQNKDHVKTIINKSQPDVIIHCASLTNVDYCEMNQSEAYSVNVKSSVNLCEAADTQKIIFISSDSVYEGTSNNYREDAACDEPKNYYGYTKRQSEKIFSEYSNSLVLRTNIFGWNVQNKKSLGEWIIGELEHDRKINGFTDALFSSMYTMELARIIGIAIINDVNGIYNCASSDYCSKYDFANEIASAFGFEQKNIIGISIDDFKFKAARGKKLSLNVSKIEKALNYKIPSIHYSVDQFYRDYKTGVHETIKSFGNQPGGGTSRISYGRQWINNDDLKAVQNVLGSDYLTQGVEVGRFEDALAQFCKSDYCVAVNSGTAALHIACLAIGITTGDEVITSPITFVASANCVIYCGGKPVFADIDSKTYNISLPEIEKRITAKTRAIIPVHFAGQSCDMEKLSAIVEKAEQKFGNKVYIIEDACHALGSKYNGQMVGSSDYSDMTVMSFHPVKHITTGEGGAVLTRNPAILTKLKLYRSHGITSEEDLLRNLEESFDDINQIKKTWYYEQIDLGYNYRITDIQCALGTSQLCRLPSFIKRRRHIVDAYNKAFKDIANLTIPFEMDQGESNFHLYVLQIDYKAIDISRAQFMDRLKETGILTQVHYIPVHSQPFFMENYGTGWGDFPVAEAYYENCISIPLYPLMTDNDVKKVVVAIRDLLME